MRWEKTCPLPKTHTRLRQVHDLWHEAATAYPDPDEFTLKLNACVQAARTVTFVLQKEHSKSERFEAWYGAWQSRIRTDPLMRWLVEARNTIEKEGDLETHSEAVVSLAAGAYEQVLKKMQLPPLLPPELVAAAIDVKGLDEGMRRDGVLIVERRWAVDDLPDDELLDVLGHCYGVLAAVVREAHARLGVTMRTFGGELHGLRHDRADHPTGRLPCMTATRELRTAYWHLGLDGLLEYEVSATELHRDDASLQESSTRYGPELGRHRVHPGMPVEEQAEAMHRIGRRVLQVDGFHRAYAWLHAAGKPVAQLILDSEDQQDKVVKTRLLAADVDRLGADVVFFVAETWLAEPVAPDDPRFKLRAGDRDDRREALVSYLLRRDGPQLMWASVFTRTSDGQIVFAEPSKTEFSDVSIFEPVLRVWRSWETRATG